MIMQSESKSAVDTFIRRFKSVKDFDPKKSTAKVLRYVQDLIKVVNKLSKQLFSYTTSAYGSHSHTGTQSFLNMPRQYNGPITTAAGYSNFDMKQHHMIPQAPVSQ